MSKLVVVEFRKYPNGDIIALMPTRKHGPYIESYTSGRGREEVMKSVVIRHTAPATPDEFSRLYHELAAEGYTFKVKGHNLQWRVRTCASQ